MMFRTDDGWNIAGHDDAVVYLKQAIAGGRVGHAYLITGPAGIGRTTVALRFAMALNCLNRRDGGICGVCDSCRRLINPENLSHPDVTLADVEWQAALLGSRSGGARQRLSIDAIRWLRRDIVTRPVLGAWKVQIVDDAGQLSDVAPDAYLKTLEEPPGSAIVILIASSPESVPETIRSRCQSIQLGLVPRADIIDVLERTGVDEGDVESIVSIARGRVGEAIRLANDPEAIAQWKSDVQQALAFIREPLQRLQLAGSIAAGHTRNREKTFSILDHCSGLWRDALLIKAGLPGQVAYPGARSALAPVVETLDPAEIARALQATQRASLDLDRNFQARITMLAMIQRWPGPTS